MSTTTHRTARVIALLVAAAAFVTALALPAGASARPRCPAGDFCIYQHANYKGPWYHWHLSDRNLFNNKFQNRKTGRRTNVTVGFNGSSVYNGGVPAAHDDVRLFYNLDSDVVSLCIPRESGIRNLASKPLEGTNGSWNDETARFRWVALC